MVCSSCHQHIIEGQYRYRDGGPRWITIHRACSADDPQWRKMDSEQSANHHRLTLRLEAFKQFRETWKTHSLDDEITEMERVL